VSPLQPGQSTAKRDPHGDAYTAILIRAALADVQTGAVTATEWFRAVGCVRAVVKQIHPVSYPAFACTLVRAALNRLAPFRKSSRRGGTDEPVSAAARPERHAPRITEWRLEGNSPVLRARCRRANRRTSAPSSTRTSPSQTLRGHSAALLPQGLDSSACGASPPCRNQSANSVQVAPTFAVGATRHPIGSGGGLPGAG
jgi:hypothetical protein